MNWGVFVQLYPPGRSLTSSQLLSVGWTPWLRFGSLLGWPEAEAEPPEFAVPITRSLSCWVLSLAAPITLSIVCFAFSPMPCTNQSLIYLQFSWFDVLNPPFQSVNFVATSGGGVETEVKQPPKKPLPERGGLVAWRWVCRRILCTIIAPPPATFVEDISSNTLRALLSFLVRALILMKMEDKSFYNSERLRREGWSERWDGWGGIFVDLFQ